MMMLPRSAIIVSPTLHVDALGFLAKFYGKLGYKTLDVFAPKLECCHNVSNMMMTRPGDVIALHAWQNILDSLLEPPAKSKVRPR